jgi:hypothetical protein
MSSPAPAPAPAQCTPEEWQQGLDYWRAHFAAVNAAKVCEYNKRTGENLPLDTWMVKDKDKDLWLMAKIVFGPY